MKINWLKRLMLFVVFCVLQALVLNNIHLFNCATPLLYVMFVLLFRRGFPRAASLVWSFLLGLAVDSFSNTPGVAAASMTLSAFIQPYILEAFVPRDSPEDLQPAPLTLGVSSYVSYVLILVLVYCLLFFTLETFSFFNWLHWLECVGGSAALTSVIILVIGFVTHRS